MFKSLNRHIMSLSPQVLLSSVNRKECVSKMKDLPILSSFAKKVKYDAAVLVPLCVENGEVCLLYTLRSSNLNNHRGQVSFPGGKMDEGETPIDTALRETEEEIGIRSNDIDVWGEMPATLGRNKEILITPIVGQLHNFDRSKLIISEDEVEEVFTVPMKSLCDAKNHAHFRFEKLQLPIFLTEKHKIWGITGMMTHWFLECFLPESVYQCDFTRKRYSINDLMPSPKL